MNSIYKVVNKITGNFYIGKTVGLPEKRLYAHFKDVEYGSTTHFHNAIRKYGNSCFQLEILETNIENLNEREKHWISVLNPHYNISKGGDGGWIFNQTGNTWKVRDSSKMGRIFKQRRQAEFIDYSKNSGGNNYQSIYYIMTPWGTFETWADAIKEARQQRKKGNRFVVTDKETLRSYCSGKILCGQRTIPEWRGKHSKEVGFNIVSK